MRRDTRLALIQRERRLSENQGAKVPLMNKIKDFRTSRAGTDDSGDLGKPIQGLSL